MVVPYRRGNKLVVGTTQSGKSYAELHDILAAAAAREVAIVVIDPHARSLAWNALSHLVARGYQRRIIFDQLVQLERVPAYRFLRPSRARHPLRRLDDNHQAAELFAELLCRRRDASSLATAPQTEEWTMKAVLLLLNQPHDLPASDIRYAFQPANPHFQRLLRLCTDEDIRQHFTEVADGSIRRGQYAAAQRLTALPQGGIDQITGAVHYLQPGRSSLKSRGVYDSEDVRAELLKRDDPDEYERRLREKYIRGVQEDRPAVISVNTLVAAMAVNELLARIHRFRYDENDTYASLRYAVHEPFVFREAESALPPCSVLGKHVGSGDVTPLLDRPELSEGGPQ